MIRTYIKEGQVVPMEVTIKLLENAMRAALQEGREGEGWKDGKGRFLIDGFPRKMDQAVKFDEDVCFYHCHRLRCIVNITTFLGLRSTRSAFLRDHGGGDAEAFVEAERN